MMILEHHSQHIWLYTHFSIKRLWRCVPNCFWQLISTAGQFILFFGYHFVEHKTLLISTRKTRTHWISSWILLCLQVFIFKFLEFFTSIHVAQIVDNYDSLNCHFWCFLTTKYVSLKLACVLRSLIKKNWHAQFFFLIWYSCLGITMNPE